MVRCVVWVQALVRAVVLDELIIVLCLRATISQLPVLPPPALLYAEVFHTGEGDGANEER